ncbi:hypothetical protein HRJ45_20125 [Vibrio coralliilyticus]|uniref:hypothetical protein n=1 Tax=Vibrio coralliilyticus TaxID=190893 RepID=UPI00156036DB|nr:hypothetical protein [Vibrio coralliilyticus]NRF27152.1 hypothetical protein [Vibrio coralliilyticus]NRF81422.1 hypothetical protein [Vibrio coralliilyticus]
MEKLMYLGFCFGNAYESIENIGYVIAITAKPHRYYPFAVSAVTGMLRVRFVINLPND